MRYLDGLLLHEIILMILGILLFMVLLVGISIYIFKKEPIKKFLVFFPIPIIMIAYPSIEKVKFLNNLVDLDKKIEEVSNNPADSAAIKDLQKGLEEIEDYPVKTPETLTTLGRAHLVLKNFELAEMFAESAIDQNPELEKAIEIKNLSQTVQNIEKLTQETSSLEAKENLQQNLNQLAQIQTRSAYRTKEIAQGYLALGDTNKVVQYLDSTLQ